MISRSKVLIVDDDDAFRQAISIFLREQFSIEIREARNYQEALQQLEGLDLIFVDISLPGENGLDLTAKLKSEHPEFVVSILTIHDSPEYREAALKRGADYFVSKGAPAEKILEVLQYVVARTRPNRMRFQ